MSPGSIAEIKDSSTRLRAMGGETAFSWTCERGFSAFSPLFPPNLALHRSRMLIALAAATENGFIGPQAGILTGSGQQKLARGSGQSPGGCETSSLEGNRPGFSKSGRTSHFGTRRIGRRFPDKKPEKAPSKSSPRAPSRSCVCFPLHSSFASFLRILRVRATARTSREFRSPRATRLASSARPLACPDHKLLSAGFFEGFRKGVSMRRSPEFLAWFLGKPSDKPKVRFF
jgi:hypothetical protein